MEEFPTIAEGDVLMHLRFLPGFDPETFAIGDTGLFLTVVQMPDDAVHVAVHKA